MKPEELKIIAEGMGVEIEDSKLCGLTVVKSNSAIYLRDIYNPLTNDTQLVEIMEKLRVGVEHSSGEIWLAYADRFQPYSQGKTINEAVCKAALEYFKG